MTKLFSVITWKDDVGLPSIKMGFWGKMSSVLDVINYTFPGHTQVAMKAGNCKYVSLELGVKVCTSNVN